MEASWLVLLQTRLLLQSLGRASSCAGRNSVRVSSALDRVKYLFRQQIDSKPGAHWATVGHDDLEAVVPGSLRMFRRLFFYEGISTAAAAENPPMKQSAAGYKVCADNMVLQESLL